MSKISEWYTDIELYIFSQVIDEMSLDEIKFREKENPFYDAPISDSEIERIYEEAVKRHKWFKKSNLR